MIGRPVWMSSMLKLGNIALDVPFLQASLSGYSDRAMRSLARERGAPLTFSGMMLARIARYRAVLRRPAFAVGDDEHPIGAQIAGDDPEEMADGAVALRDAGYDLIDLNFACPARKILRRGRGGHLLTKPSLVLEIYRRVRDTVDCPVLMKLRSGFDESPESRENFDAICDGAAGEGIDALIIHGRTVLQKYSGTADWDVLANIKERHPRTTLIGSGDLFDARAAADRLSQGVVDGVAIARGAIGNPWIYEQLRAILAGDPAPPPPGLAEQGAMVREHFARIVELYPLRKAVGYFRKFTVGYCKLHPDRKAAQAAFIRARSREEVLAAIGEWYGGV